MALVKNKTTNLLPMVYRILLLFAFILMSFGKIGQTNSTAKKVAFSAIQPQVIDTTKTQLLAENKKETFSVKCRAFYDAIETAHFSLPQFESFSKAFQGYEQLKKQGKIKNEILTIVDFSLSSNVDRMWVIDMNTQEVLLQTLVAHGMKSGDEFATSFSNTSESHQSSLGFYLTGEEYQGKHGKSLRLDGIEYGINSNARERAVVIHGADYVSKDFIKNNKRLGRSYGCPAVSYEVSDKLINLIKNKSVLFIYHPSRSYVVKSKLVS